jgi:hypothetical protein
MKSEKSIEVTPEMIAAGADILSHWKGESEFVSERQAIEELFMAMGISATFSDKKN